MLKRAIERNLEIIGEATNRILTRDPSFTDKISNAKGIVGLRNQVIHSYDNISDENIWSILINHLPKLKAEVDALIQELAVSLTKLNADKPMFRKIKLNRKWNSHSSLLYLYIFK